MIKKIFSIRDGKVEAYGQPFFQHTHGEAERNFKSLTSDPKSNISQFPEDYDLFYLGDFDDSTGLVTPLQTPQHVAKAMHLKN